LLSQRPAGGGGCPGPGPRRLHPPSVEGPVWTVEPRRSGGLANLCFLACNTVDKHYIISRGASNTEVLFV